MAYFGINVNFIIQGFKIFKIAQFLEREKIWEKWEIFSHKIQTWYGETVVSIFQSDHFQFEKLCGIDCDWGEQYR